MKRCESVLFEGQVSLLHREEIAGKPDSLALRELYVTFNWSMFYLCALVCGFQGELLAYSNSTVHVSNYIQPECTPNCSLSFDFC